jgi:DNA-binding NtrC family response regulator
MATAGAIKAAVLTLAAGPNHAATTVLRARGCTVRQACVSSDAAASVILDADVIVVECTPARDDPGLDLAKRIQALDRGTPIIILAAESSETLAIEALRLGAYEYVRGAIDIERLADAVASFDKRAQCERHLREQSLIVGDSAAMRFIREYVRNVAPTDSSVLITGETGTGKEVVAEYLHRQSRRRDRPFVCINCAAIPDTLLESELFGYSRGAFTGAVTSRSGKLAQANGGTVFFDEIGEMTPFAQAKILRAIESREVYPLGADRGIRLDIRIVAATSRDLESMMKNDHFRPDLYFRLNVARIALPPLRERPSDIPLLIQYLLPRYNRSFGLHVENISEETLEELQSYSWPGNIRELKNVLEIIFLNRPQRTIGLEHLPRQVRTVRESGEQVRTGERDQLMAALLATRWNVSEAARKLHWSRMTLYRKLAKYNIATVREPRNV